MFDLPSPHDVGELRILRHRIWVSWISRAVLYGIPIIVLYLFCYRAGLPVTFLVRTAIVVFAFCLSVIVLSRMAIFFAEKQRRAGTSRPRVHRAVTPKGFIVHGAEVITRRIPWESCRDARLVKIGEYIETGNGLWRLRMIYRLRLCGLLGAKKSYLFACPEHVARDIHQRTQELIDKCQRNRTSRSTATLEVA